MPQRATGLAPGIRRLASAESKQLGKVRMLVGPESHRPRQRKPSFTKYERPLTSSDILEKQERHKILTQAGVVLSKSALVRPGTGSQDKSQIGVARSILRTGSMQGLKVQTDLDDMPPEAWEALRAHRERKRLQAENQETRKESFITAGPLGVLDACVTPSASPFTSSTQSCNISNAPGSPPAITLPGMQPTTIVESCASSHGEQLCSRQQ